MGVVIADACGQRQRALLPTLPKECRGDMLEASRASSIPEGNYPR